MSDTIKTSNLNVNQSANVLSVDTNVNQNNNPADIGAVNTLLAEVSNVTNVIDPAIATDNSNQINTTSNNVVIDPVSNAVITTQNSYVAENDPATNPFVDNANLLTTNIKISEIDSDIQNVNLKDQSEISEKDIKLYEEASELTALFKPSTNAEQLFSIKEKVKETQQKITQRVDELTSLVASSKHEEKDEVLLAGLLKHSESLSSIKAAINNLDEFTKDLKAINSDETLDTNQKLEQLKSLYDDVKKQQYFSPCEHNVRLDMIAQSVMAQSFITNEVEEFVNGLSFKNLDNQDSGQIEFLKYTSTLNLSRLLSLLFLEFNDNNVNSDEYKLEALFNSFVKSYVSFDKDASNNDKKIEFIQQINELYNTTDTKEIYSKIDKLFLFDNPSLAYSIKASFTAPSEYNLLETTHSYKKALLNIIKSLPKADQENLKGKTYFDNDVYKALIANNKIYQDHKYQLIHFISLQHRLVQSNLIENIDSNFDKSMHIALAQALCIDIAGDEKVTEVLDELCNGKNGKNSVNSTEFVNVIIKNVKDLSDKYEIQHLEGEVAEKLSNAKASNENDLMISDSVHDIKTLRVFDKVLQNFTGVMDDHKSGIQTDDEKLSKLNDGLIFDKTNLKSELQKGINSGLINHFGYSKNLSTKDILLMKAYLKTDSNDVDLIIKEFNQKVGAKIDLAAFRSIDSEAKLKELREKFDNYLNTLNTFSKKNDECIKIHRLKKELNASYKAKKEAFDSLSFVWPWDKPKRRENVNLIRDLAAEHEELLRLQNKLNTTLDEQDRSWMNNAIIALNESIKEKLEKVQDLDLTDLVSKKKDFDPNKKVDIKEFLEKALPIVDAFIYFKGRGDGSDPKCKDDMLLIDSLKFIRDNSRKELKYHLNLAKNIFGSKTLTQIQRAIMLSVYIVSLENPGKNAQAYNPKNREKIDNILKDRFGLDTSNGVINALVSDTISHYTDPNGNITEKYLSIIESKLCKEPIVVSDHSAVGSAKAIDELEVDSIKQFKLKGSSTLLTYVENPGNSFTYSKESGIAPGVAISDSMLAAHFSDDECIVVSNTGHDFEVFLKSKYVSELAAKFGLIDDSIDAKQSAHLRGLKLNFNTKEELSAFLEDFMDNSSKLQTDKNYRPLWIEKCSFSTVSGKDFGATPSVSAGVALNALKTMSKSIGKTSAILQVPDVKVKVGSGIIHNSTTTKEGDLTLTTSKNQFQLISETKIAAPKVNNENTQELDNYKSDIDEAILSLSGDKIESVGAFDSSSQSDISDKLNIEDDSKVNEALFSIVDTETTVAFNDNSKVYTAQTSLKQSVPKGNMSLENSLLLLDIPENELTKLVQNKELFEKLKDTYSKAQATDSVVVNYSIKADALEKINNLQGRWSLEEDSILKFSIKQQIEELLADKSNYEPASISIDVSNEQRKYTPVNIFADLDLGAIALDYARKFMNGLSHSFDIKSGEETISKIETTIDVKNSNSANNVQSEKARVDNQLNVDDYFDETAKIIDQSTDEHIDIDDLLNKYMYLNEASKSNMVNLLLDQNKGELVKKIIKASSHTTKVSKISATDAQKIEAKNEKVNADIKPKQFFKQTFGKNTCFMMSVLNALSSTENGTAHLKKFITKNGFRLKLKGGQDVYHQFYKDKSGYSTLERTLVDVYQIYDKDHKDRGMGVATTVAQQMFSLSLTKERFFADVKVGMPALTFQDLKDAFTDTVDKADAVICRYFTIFGAFSSHYVAIVGTSEENGECYVHIKDSNRDEDSPIKKMTFEEFMKKKPDVSFFKI